MTDIEDLDKKFGFSRPEMCGCITGDHIGSLDIHLKVHVFVATRISFDQWKPDSSNVLPKGGGKKEEGPKEKKENCFYAPDLPEGTVWVFEQNDLRNTAMSVLQFPSLEAFHAKTQGSPVTRYDYFVFVCCHTQKDDRCAYCGPILLKALTDVAASSGKASRVGIFAVNHIGGHKYAGNVLMYTRRRAMWYGYVCPKDVPLLMNGMLGEESSATATTAPPPLPHLLRGLMGLPVSQQVAEITLWKTQQAQQQQSRELGPIVLTVARMLFWTTVVFLCRPK